MRSVSVKRLRLFVAADLPGEVRERIASAAEAARTLEGARWVKAENLHLTLKFIGDYEEDKLERLREEVAAAAALCTGFTAALGGCGAFPSHSRARVLWLGMARGEEEAAATARKLDSRLERLGVKREERPFRGHLTLARLRIPSDCSSWLEGLEERLKDLRDMDFEVGEIVLYRSILGPQGPTYVPVERAPLKGS